MAWRANFSAGRLRNYGERFMWASPVSVSRRYRRSQLWQMLSERCRARLQRHGEFLGGNPLLASKGATFPHRLFDGEGAE
jgi:hypothetical protein